MGALRELDAKVLLALADAFTARQQLTPAEVAAAAGISEAGAQLGLVRLRLAGHAIQTDPGASDRWVITFDGAQALLDLVD